MNRLIQYCTKHGWKLEIKKYSKNLRALEATRAGAMVCYRLMLVMNIDRMIEMMMDIDKTKIVEKDQVTFAF